MKLRRIRLRTLMILVIAVALPIELVGLGRRSRHYAAQARDADQAERVNRDVARNSRLAASQAAEQADRLAATEPAKAAALRHRVDRLLGSIPFFEAQAGRA